MRGICPGTAAGTFPGKSSGKLEIPPGDSRRHVAVVHAGWRGSLEQISGEAVAALGGLGSDPADLVAWMGPTISREAYEIAPELAAQFQVAFSDYSGILVDRHLDLVLLNAWQLYAAGVPAAQIHAANCCTACRREHCYSFRAEGKGAGRMVAYAMILSREPLDAESG